MRNAQIVFDNPNDPPQPRVGVYMWYFIYKDAEICVYIGNAGERASRVQKSTLLRAIHEACRTTFSTDSNKGIRYTRLDTDFVLGTCIQYLIENGIDCHWKHISDNPKKEKAFAQEHNPVIQNESAKIYSEMKIKMSNRYWDITKAANRPATELDRVYGEAKEKVSQEFLQKLKKRGVHI